MKVMVVSVASHTALPVVVASSRAAPRDSRAFEQVPHLLDLGDGL